MPSVPTHAVVGLLASAASHPRHAPIRFWALSILCAAWPDLDSIGLRHGIPYASFYGHRGFFHSLFASAVFAALLALVFFWGKRWGWKQRGLLWLYFTALGASHGLLDACTTGGLGIALLSPFDPSRYFFAWRPILVSPLGFYRFFTKSGWRVLQSEMRWVWAPGFCLTLLASAFRYAWRKRGGGR